LCVTSDGAPDATSHVLVPAAIRTARREITHSPEREVPTSVKRHLVIAAVTAACLVFATSALAATIYVGPRYWSCYCDASSSYSSSWYWNDFYKTTSGVSDTMVTLIDNGAFGYSWHGTVRNTAKIQHAYWGLAYVKKGYCKFYSGTAFNGSCAVGS
jgi:hypothetical protein